MKPQLPLVLLFTFFCFIACDHGIKSPCDDLVDGVYEFPDLPEHDDWTSEIVDDYLNIPEDICDCICTDGLLQTCLNYPYLNLIFAGSSLQSGYNLVYDRFNGFAELESKTDAGEVLLEHYKKMWVIYDTLLTATEVSEYIFNFYAFELIFSQKNILLKLDNQGKIDLVEKCIENYYLKKNALNDWSSTFESSTFIPLNLMLLDDYKQLEDFTCLNCDYVNLIVETAEEYLEYLESKM